ncbi:MAG: DUF2974 domain-containing protein [Ruminococcaceae bacterium]|nr:DUF2974 domain-containing protein [Oscillospiraceae bacterium]
MTLTPEQLLLLNNLMYMETQPFGTVHDYEGQSIGDWLDSIPMDSINPDRDYGSFITGEDWQNIINAVQNDPVLRDMVIADTHVDTSSDGGRGRSAIFVSEETGDAVVTFKGTETAAEWGDNFDGGNVPDTPHQENALEWYQQAYEENGLSNYEVTVTGHSKGGNKSKYIAIMDDTVDHCVSFDGQGFSDKFMEKYADRIAQRQDVIQNHNVDYDYVNLLINDVGETTYYYGQDLGNGGFLENHSPNTFFRFNEDGTFEIVTRPDGQPPEMQALDELFNNLLRSMSDEQRSDMLDMVNEFINTAFSIEDGQSGVDIANLFIDLAMDPKYADELSYLLAYLIEYEQANPEMMDQINNVLAQFGMGDFSQYVDIVDNILSFNMDTPFGTLTFDNIVDFIADHGGDIPDWLLDILSDFLMNQFGVSLSPEQMQVLLQIVVMTNDNMDRIEITDNGGDIRVPSGSGGGNCTFTVETQQLLAVADRIRGTTRSLDQIAASVDRISGIVPMSFVRSILIRNSLRAVRNQINRLGSEADQLGAALQEIAVMYERTENSITSNAGG